MVQSPDRLGKSMLDMAAFLAAAFRSRESSLARLLSTRVQRVGML